MSERQSGWWWCKLINTWMPLFWNTEKFVIPYTLMQWESGDVEVGERIPSPDETVPVNTMRLDKAIEIFRKEQEKQFRLSLDNLAPMQSYYIASSVAYKKLITEMEKEGGGG